MVAAFTQKRGPGKRGGVALKKESRVGYGCNKSTVANRGRIVAESLLEKERRMESKAQAAEEPRQA